MREEAGSVGERAALLVRARGEARSDLAGELAAASVTHAHLLVPFDHWTEGEWLVLAYPLPEATLADRLGPEGLSPGAVVTVLSPVLDVLETLHGAGIAGVDLAPTAITIDAAGAPAVLLRGACVRTSSASRRWRTDDPAVEQDAVAAMSLLHRLAGAQAVPEAVSASIRDRRWSDAAGALLEWAAPLPLSAEFGEPESDAPNVPPAKSHPTRRSLRRSSARRGVIPRLNVALPMVWQTAARVRDGVRSVRPKVWALGAAGLAAVVAAVVMTAGGGTETAATSPTQAVGAPTASEEAPERTAHAEPEPEPAPEAELETLLAELIAERERCLDLADQHCLQQVVQSGSLLYRDDAAGMPAWRSAGEVDVVVEQRIGDAVIARIEGDTQPASMLAVSTEAGWMIREIWR